MIDMETYIGRNIQDPQRDRLVTLVITVSRLILYIGILMFIWFHSIARGEAARINWALE